MTLRGGGGVACDANFFVCVFVLCCFLFVNYYSKYSTGHFIAELTLYQMLESGKDTWLHRPDDRHNKQFIDTVRTGV